MISPVHLVSGFSWSLDGSWQGNPICPRPFLEALLISRFCWEWEFFFHTGFTLLSRVRKDTPPPPFLHTFLVTWVFPLTRESASETRFWSHKSQNEDLCVPTKAFYLHSLSFLRILLSRISREVKITPVISVNSFAVHWTDLCPGCCRSNAILSSKEGLHCFMTLSLCWPRVLLLSGVG